MYKYDVQIWRGDRKLMTLNVADTDSLNTAPIAHHFGFHETIFHNAYTQTDGTQVRCGRYRDRHSGDVAIVTTWTATS